MTQYQLKDRLLGLFMGQLVGDAVGTRYEFMNSVNVKQKILDDISSNATNDTGPNEILPLLGGGPFNVLSGQYTDDSELALGIWYCFLVYKKYDINDISNIFYAWYESGPFDIGNATRNAFSGGNTYEKMKHNAKKYNSGNLSNGCLMKISPIGAIDIIGVGSDFHKCAKEVCRLTNPNKLCVDMCVAYVIAINTALKTGDPIKVYTQAKISTRLKITSIILEDLKRKDQRLLTENITRAGFIRGFLG